MKKITFFLFFLFTLQSFGQRPHTAFNNKYLGKDPGVPAIASITDTIHVSHYSIYIDTINFTSHTIRAKAELTVVAKLNGVSLVSLSLLKLNIDSITTPIGNSFTYNDTTIFITLATPLNQNDTAFITIYYQGIPQQDASGWGGFYFSGSYAFNLGVGFAADPHNYGRVWYPCLDEFTDRSSYDFYINTDPAHKAFCNGSLISETLNPNGTKTWFWSMQETIPSYLASMAVAPFYSLERTSNGIPVVWACLPGDTAKTLNTFSNLDTILAGFINAYGPYPFSKVGYVEIPFNSGAMEHASSIHIGKAFIDGSKTYETLWAHELSHMWWGDKVTCETAGDMWLNEGFASFNEAFTEGIVSGIPAYKDWLRSNHRQVLQFTHTPAQDGAYFAEINIPHAYTYGMTVYKKGADLVHTLRYYMGDSLFFGGCKYHLNANAYGNSNSYQLRDNLTASSGINMNRFFDDWIFTPGFPHFSIDSVNEFIGAFNHYYIHTRQKTKGNSHLYAMPVELNLTDGINDTTVTVTIDSLTNTFHVALLFTPVWFSLDRNEKISDAISDYEKTISVTGNISMPETFVSLNVINAVNGTSRLRIEHNWVAPDPFQNIAAGIRISDYHYWKADGIFDPGFLSKATFSYNGTNGPSTGYVDNTLILAGNSEDSLVILYRPGAGYEWFPVNGFTVNKGVNAFDKIGSITIDTLKKGEYAFGIYDYTITGISGGQASPDIYSLKASPNPVNGYCQFTFNLGDEKDVELQITDSTGKQIFHTRVKKGQETLNWNSAGYKAGTYEVHLVSRSKILGNTKVVLVR